MNAAQKQFQNERVKRMRGDKPTRQKRIHLEAQTRKPAR